MGKWVSNEPSNSLPAELPNFIINWFILGSYIDLKHFNIVYYHVTQSIRWFWSLRGDNCGFMACNWTFLINVVFLLC